MNLLSATGRHGCPQCFGSGTLTDFGGRTAPIGPYTVRPCPCSTHIVWDTQIVVPLETQFCWEIVDSPDVNVLSAGEPHPSLLG